MYESVGHLRIWSYIGMNRAGETIFSGVGGGLYKKYGHGFAPAFEGLQKMLAAAAPHGKVDLYINNMNLRKNFAEVMSGNENINILEVRPTELALNAIKSADSYGRKIATDVVVTTDAAISHQGEVMGAGWIMAFGTYARVYGGAKSIELHHRVRESLTAELLAIEAGVEHALTRASTLRRGWGTLTVRSDSLPAINILNAMMAGEKELVGTSRRWVIARRILDLLDNVNVKFVWVRGHNGDEMNEFADRLARAARRNAECGVSSSVDEEMVAGICREAFLTMRNRKLSDIA
jgi:ribonuclease HI